MYARVKFFRRRQFVLGPAYLDYKGWHRIHLFDQFRLTLHPDLPVTVCEQQKNKAVLLGYAIDPYNPDHDDEAILRGFVGEEIKLERIIDKLESLGGRYVLIINSSQGKWLFHDACALRQVNYCVDSKGNTWCASQPETLAEHFRFEYDDEVLSFREAAISALTKEEFWLINDRTPYREIRCLLANHYLDLERGEAIRFWPNSGRIKTLSIHECIRLTSPLLQNSIAAATKRFNLKMGISAGSDSRRTLAATRNVTKEIYYFTHTPDTYRADMEVPARLLPRLGIVHHAHELQTMSSDFRDLYERSATWARERRGHIAYTALKYFGPEASVLNSNLSEIHQCWYWLPKSKINGEGLAILTRLNHMHAVNEFQKWIDDAESACKVSGMNILVLFDYELRSRWVTAALSEYDIAYETFNPYNNRYIFSLEFAIDESLRSGQRLDVIIEQIRYLWPEVLEEPINPESDIKKIIWQFITNRIVHRYITPKVPAYQYLKYLKRKWRYGKVARHQHLKK